MIFVVVLEHYREELFRPMLHVSLQQQQSVQSSFPNVGALGIQNDVGRPVGNWRRGWIFPVLHFHWRHGQRMVACGRWCRKAHRVFHTSEWSLPWHLLNVNSLLSLRLDVSQITRILMLLDSIHRIPAIHVRMLVHEEPFLNWWTDCVHWKKFINSLSCLCVEIEQWIQNTK